MKLLLIAGIRIIFPLIENALALTKPHKTSRTTVVSIFISCLFVVKLKMIT